MLYLEIREDLNEEETKKKGKTEVEEFYDSWQWYEILRELSNGDLSKMDYYAGLPVHQVLTDLHYQKHKQQLTNYLNRKQNGR